MRHRTGDKSLECQEKIWVNQFRAISPGSILTYKNILIFLMLCLWGNQGSQVIHNRCGAVLKVPEQSC